MTLKTQKLSSLEQVRRSLAGTACVPSAVPAVQDRYRWVAQSLKQFGYQGFGRPERELMVCFQSDRIYYKEEDPEVRRCSEAALAAGAVQSQMDRYFKYK